MKLDDIDELIRKYLSTGIAVMVILVAPGAPTDDPALTSDAAVVDPNRVGAVHTTEAHTTEADTGADTEGTSTSDTDTVPTDRTGADGSDPDTDPSGPDTARTGSGKSDSGTSKHPSRTRAPQTPATPEKAGRSGSRASGIDGTTAADRFGWGTPEREDDFSGGADQWDIYGGPGHAGQGTRSPSAVSIDHGMLTITGDSSGTTAGMAWNPGRRYGRWEGRVKAPVADPSYNALLLMWPDAENFPVGGEIDFMEMADAKRQQTDMFVHYGSDNSQVNGQVEIDGTQWHNWAVEWTPDGITAFVDGQEWYRTADADVLPPGPMHLCIQLDWFPEGENPAESTMQVDWVRQYSLEGATASNDPARAAKPGSAGTGNKDAESNGDETSAATDGAPAKESKTGTGDSSTPVREAIRRMFGWR